VRDERNIEEVRVSIAEPCHRDAHEPARACRDGNIP
jgi:hypothetical protein